MSSDRPAGHKSVAEQEADSLRASARKLREVAEILRQVSGDPWNDKAAGFERDADMMEADAAKRAPRSSRSGSP